MAKSKKKIGSSVEDIVKWYEDGKAYQNSIGITKTMPECVRFFEGDQWAPVTKDTKHFPRPVVNIIEMNINNKKSQVLSSPIKIVYKSENKNADIDRFNRFAAYQLARLKQEEMNNQAVLDAEIKGSFCLYYYWDKDVVGLDGLVEGDIAVQLIDPSNVIFANPNEKDEQKQDWVMLVSRETIDYVKKIADSGVDKRKIEDDDSESIYNETESDTSKFVTVFTRFFRHDGEVYFERATRQVMFNEARPFTPNIEHFKNSIDGTEEEQVEAPRNEYMRVEKATLYPIIFSQWKQRDKSIYGRGEVETIIPNQKAINWTLGLQLLVAQNEGMSPVVVAPDALRGQKITNAPGQVIVNYSKSGKGIEFPNKPGMSQAGVNLVEKIADLTRVAVGSSEVMNGEIISAGMSGAAIAQLQSQALKPIEDLQKNYWRAMKKVGEILEQFMRFFYNNKKFTYIDAKDEKEESKVDEFNSSDFKDIHFDVVAEAIAGTVMSDVANINMLDNLYAKGAINLKTYLKCYPDNAIANRQKLLDCIDNEELNIVQNLTMQLEALKQEMDKANAIIEEKDKVLSSALTVINENNTLKEKLWQLSANYSMRMQQANAIWQGAVKQANEYRSDATMMAKELAGIRGLNIQPQDAEMAQQQDNPDVN